MINDNPIKTALIDADDSVLILIDVQSAFANKLEPAVRDPILERIGWIVNVAIGLKIPIIAMGEDIGEGEHSNDQMVEQIRNKLPNDQIIHNKMMFGLAGDVDILKAVKKTGRDQAILVGFETDVCVSQSAIGLLNQHFSVAALADATGSPGDGYKNGLRRMGQSGVLITDVKSLYYEWIRSVNADNNFKSQFLNTISIPTGLIL